MDLPNSHPINHPVLEVYQSTGEITYFFVQKLIGFVLNRTPDIIPLHKQSSRTSAKVAGQIIFDVIIANFPLIKVSLTRIQ